MSDAPAAAVEAAQPAEEVEAPVAAVEETKEETKAEEAGPAAAPAVEEKTEQKPAEDGAAKQPAGKAEHGKASKTSKSSSKFDPSVLPESEDHAAIRTQVHFYFSDSNLPTDKFLWELTGGAENKPVELKKICQFGRMRRFKSYETVVEALRESKFLTVSGEPGAEVVVRKNAYNPDRPRNKIDTATVYVKGFGDEEPSTQFDLEAFFTKFGPINCVRLRRTGENLFKGSVFVEFQDPEQAEAFLALDPKPQWRDQELKIMSKPAYVAEKSQLIREGKIEPNTNSAQRFFEGRIVGGNRRGGFRGRGGNGNGNGNATDKNDWKKRRDDDRKNGFRGGRGRGGGRGNGRGGGRGGNWNNKDRNDRGDRNGQQNGKPVIHATNDKGEVVEATNGKRSREDDGASTEPPAKKVDSKTEAAAGAA